MTFICGTWCIPAPVPAAAMPESDGTFRYQYSVLSDSRNAGLPDSRLVVNADGGLIFLSAGLITFSIIADDFYANTAPATVSAVVSVVIPPFLPISLLLSPPLGDVQVNASAQIYVIARGGLPQDNLYQYSALPQGFVSVQRDGGLLFVSVGRIPFTVIADDGDGGANPATLIATVAVRGRYDIVHIGGAAITIFNNATVVRDAQVGSFFVAGEDLRGVADAVVNIAPSSLWSLRPLNPAGVFGRGFGRGFGALLITSAAMTNNYTATIIVRDSQGELLAATAYLSVHFDRSQIRAVPQVSATLGVRTLPLSLAWLFERGVGAYSITVIGAQVSANGHLVNVIAPVADVAGLQSITIIADDENADTPPLTVAHTVLRYAPELSLDIDYLRRYIERDIGFLRGLAVVRAIGGGFADGGYTLRLFARSDNAADFTIGDSVRTLTSDIVGRTDAIRVAATSGARRAAKYTVRPTISEVKVRTESPIVKSAALSLRAKSRKVYRHRQSRRQSPAQPPSRAKSRYRAQYSGANSQYPKKVLAHNAKRYVRQSKAAYRHFHHRQ